MTFPAAEAQRRPTAFLAETLRSGVVPFALAVPLLTATCWASEHRPLGRVTLGIYLAVAVLLVVCEQRVPFDRRWGRAIRANRTDLVYVIVASAMDKAMFVVCVTGVAAIGALLSDRIGIAMWPTGWPIGFQIALALVVADAGAYLRHRLSHWSDVLWRFHRVHHSMPGLYWIRSGYTHPVEQLCILTAIMLPISLLGAPEPVVAVVAFAFGVSGLLQHANVDARSSMLNWVFATPEVHRTHHGADDGSRSNFSAFFVVMDLLFGTYRRPVRSTNGLRVGLVDEPSFPTDFLSHLTIPFRRHTTATKRT
jgi:sterol desaturase/sphingolipid hydroxylase (fatty acid hydroxylase superfamily)